MSREYARRKKGHLAHDTHLFLVLLAENPRLEHRASCLLGFRDA